MADQYCLKGTQVKSRGWRKRLAWAKGYFKRTLERTKRFDPELVYHRAGSAMDVTVVAIFDEAGDKDEWAHTFKELLRQDGADWSMLLMDSWMVRLRVVLLGFLWTWVILGGSILPSSSCGPRARAARRSSRSFSGILMVSWYSFSISEEG